VSSLAQAVRLDRDRTLIEAAASYEQVDLSERLPGDAIANLMALYWQATDFGYSSAYALPRSFVAHAGDRLEQLLAVEYSMNRQPEPFFWKRYVRWIEYGESLSVEDCQQLMTMHSDYVEPAFHAYSLSGGAVCGELVGALVTRCKKVGTIRAEYVVSVIESTMVSAGSSPTRTV